MITAILIMIWTVTCALCAIAGFYIGKKSRKPKAAAPIELSELEQSRYKRELAEMENFFSYDGSEQNLADS